MANTVYTESKHFTLTLPEPFDAAPVKYKLKVWTTLTIPTGATHPVAVSKVYCGEAFGSFKMNGGPGNNEPVAIVLQTDSYGFSATVIPNNGNFNVSNAQVATSNTDVSHEYTKSNGEKYRIKIRLKNLAIVPPDGGSITVDLTGKLKASLERYDIDSSDWVDVGANLAKAFDFTVESHLHQ